MGAYYSGPSMWASNGGTLSPDALTRATARAIPPSALNTAADLNCDKAIKSGATPDQLAVLEAAAAQKLERVSLRMAAVNGSLAAQPVSSPSTPRPGAAAAA